MKERDQNKGGVQAGSGGRWGSQSSGGLYSMLLLMAKEEKAALSDPSSLNTPSIGKDCKTGSTSLRLLPTPQGLKVSINGR